MTILRSRSSLSSQRDSEASDLRDFGAAISSSESAKLDVQVGEVLSPWILSGRSNRLQGSSKNNDFTLLSSSGFSMDSKTFENEFSKTPFSKTPFSKSRWRQRCPKCRSSDRGGHRKSSSTQSLKRPAGSRGHAQTVKCSGGTHLSALGRAGPRENPRAPNGWSVPPDKGATPRW